VKGDSTVEAIDAVEGPTRARPAMNRTIGITVETDAISDTHMTLSPVAWMPPLNSATVQKLTAAPVDTLAAKPSDEVVSAMRSEARMKTV